MMKIGSVICVAVIILGIHSVYAGDVRYATAESGLVLRDSPSRSGKKTGMLIRNTRMEVIEVSGKEEIIEGKKSKWLRVKTSDGQAGWVFGGFTISKNEIHIAWINRIRGVSFEKSETETGIIPYRMKVEVVSFSQKGNNRMANVRWNSMSVSIDENDLSFVSIPEYIPGFKPDDENEYRANLDVYHKKMLDLFNGTKGKIIGQFGTLVGSEKDTMENRHGGKPIDFVTYKFRGIEATYLAGNNGMLYLQAARITSGKCIDGFPVSIGTEMKDVYKYLGIPTYDWGSYVIYMTGYSPAMVTISHKNGKVTGIEITNYAD
jgi:hypothetical protein